MDNENKLLISLIIFLLIITIITIPQLVKERELFNETKHDCIQWVCELRCKEGDLTFIKHGKELPCPVTNLNPVIKEKPHDWCWCRMWQDK